MRIGPQQNRLEIQEPKTMHTCLREVTATSGGLHCLA